MTKIKVLFLGTPSFAIDSLAGLLNDLFFDVIGVITQPDRPVGRSQELIMPPVKRFALEHALQVYQPNKVRDFATEIKNLNPDIIVVVAYGQIIPEQILAIPKYGCINVHGSLLPKYRGAAVVQAPIMNGDTETGVTIMLMDAGLDTGPILSQEKIILDRKETTATLFPKLSRLGATLLIPTLKKYTSEQIFPKAQDAALASKVGLLRKEHGRIDWSKSTTDIERLVRAMYPWPVAWTKWNDKTLKIIDVRHTQLNINQYEPGETFMHGNDLAIQCGINSLIIMQLQLEGKAAMKSTDFLLGNSKIVHQTLQ